MECATCLLMGICLMCGPNFGVKSSGRPLTEGEMKDALVDILQSFREVNQGITMTRKPVAKTRRPPSSSYHRRRGFVPDLRFTSGIGKRSGVGPFDLGIGHAQDGAFSQGPSSSKFGSSDGAFLDSFQNYRLASNSVPIPKSFDPFSSIPYARRPFSDWHYDSNDVDQGQDAIPTDAHIKLSTRLVSDEADAKESDEVKKIDILERLMGIGGQKKATAATARSIDDRQNVDDVRSLPFLISRLLKP